MVVLQSDSMSGILSVEQNHPKLLHASCVLLMLFVVDIHFAC